ncbi:MAG: HIT family protein, partial [Lachnospiraceae bacterium]|nr:HIT family protein [Lachnospiraceae bacterium]
GRAFVLAKKIAAHNTEVLKADGFNIVQNNGETAGQTVFHFHLHLIPRFKDDGQKIGWKPGKPSDSELKETAELLSL